jgi:hypothetical protein
MKRGLLITTVVLIMAAFAAASPAPKEKQSSGRLLTGSVFNAQGGPLNQAIVYLSNTRTRAVKTYIVGPDGTYRFPSLSSNIDYEVHAEFNGKKSDTKTVSQFDDRPQVNINLRIDAK